MKDVAVTNSSKGSDSFSESDDTSDNESKHSFVGCFRRKTTEKENKVVTAEDMERQKKKQLKKIRKEMEKEIREFEKERMKEFELLKEVL